MSERVRIYELARKMNMPAPVLIDACRELGYDVKSHSSTIDGHVVGLVIAYLGKKKQAPEKPAKAAASKEKEKDKDKDKDKEKDIEVKEKPAAAAGTSTTTTSTKAPAKAAPPPAPVVKPRVLARYRREPVVDAPPAESAQEASPAAPAVSPAVAEQQAAAAAAAAAAQAAAEGAASRVLTQAPGRGSTPISSGAPVSSGPPTAPTISSRPITRTPVEPVEPESSEPRPMSKAVLEQQAQMEAIEKAKERAQKEKDEQVALQAAREQAAHETKPGERKKGDRPPEEGRLGESGTTALRDAFAPPTRPSGPATPSQPIRIGAPSFRATPPRPPKSHRNAQPAERHMQAPTKKEEKRQAAAVVEVPKIITVIGALTVKDLSEKMSQPETEIIKRLFMKGVMRTVNQVVEPELAKELAIEMGYELATQEDIDIAAMEAEEAATPKLTEEQKAAMVTRPPVVTIMGHVDHGKTSLLDAIRQTKFLLTDAEHGGITQHIGAYHVEVPAEDGSLRQIVFLDTPGHEAFTAMRARGAKVTDIAILVVAADDGVMPQTIEAIDHAKAAGVPIIVAINKIDKGDADPERVLTDLMHHSLVPDKFGGDTVTVNVSAKKKIGLDELLEMILLVADMQDLKANPEMAATGSIVEAELSRGKGAVATALVANGTLREGDIIVAGSAWGRVRALFDDRGERVKAAGPSMPVEVLGLKEVPQAGDRFEVVADEQSARSLAEQRKELEVENRKHHVTLESFHDMLETGEVKELDIIVKADVQGTAEAIGDQLAKLSAKEVAVRVLRTASGDISETDVNLAASSNAIIIGFNVQPDANGQRAAEVAGVDIRTYNIIYQIIDDLTLAMQGLLQPIKQEVEVGTAEVRQIFKTKVITIAGCMVTSGKIPRGAIARVEREGKVIYEGKLDSLKRFKDDAREVASGFECGMSFEKFNDVQEGDIVHAFSITEVKRELTR